jgi:hypothetical protein
VYTLTARWQTGGSREGEIGPLLESDPIELKVVAPGAEYLINQKLKDRIEIRDVLIGGIAGSSYSYFAVETDGSWSTGSGTELPLGVRTETARGKLTTEELVHLTNEFGRFRLNALPESHGSPQVGSRAVETPQAMSLAAPGRRVGAGTIKFASSIPRGY